MSKYETSTITSCVNAIIRDVEDPTDGIVLDPPYQRNVVWDVEKMSKFIESVILGIVPMPLIFNETPKQKRCMDGKQRITSLYMYKRNNFHVEIGGEYVYHSKIPLEHKNNNKFREMTQKELTNFKRRNIPCINYDNLSYEDEIDIFTRLQYGMVLTSGELMLAIITDDSVNEIFLCFCNDKKDILQKFCNNIERKEHIPIIINIMLMVDKDKLKDFNKKERTKYIKSLNTVQKLRNAIDRVSPLLDNIFSDNLLGHSTIMSSNIHKNIFYTSIYSYYKDYNNDKFKNETFYKRYRSIIIKIAKIYKDTSRTQKTFQEIMLKFTNMYNSLEKKKSKFKKHNNRRKRK